jgi:hypothetical protein
MVEPVSPPPLPTPAPVAVEHTDPWKLPTQVGQETLVSVPQRTTRKSRPVQRLVILVVCLALATGIGLAVVPRQAPGEQNAEVAELQRRGRDAAEESDARAERLLERMEALEHELAARMRGEKKVVPLSAEALYAKASPAVVKVLTERPNGKGGFGTGFLVNKNGIVATNYHVMEKAQTAIVVTADNMRLPVLGTVGHDKGADIAILKVAGEISVEPLELVDKRPPVGTKVFAIGNPDGYARGRRRHRGDSNDRAHQSRVQRWAIANSRWKSCGSHHPL